jgi:hypothetical protein
MGELDENKPKEKPVEGAVKRESPSRVVFRRRRLSATHRLRRGRRGGDVAEGALCRRGNRGRRAAVVARDLPVGRFFLTTPHKPVPPKPGAEYPLPRTESYKLPTTVRKDIVRHGSAVMTYPIHPYSYVHLQKFKPDEAMVTVAVEGKERYQMKRTVGYCFVLAQKFAKAASKPGAKKTLKIVSALRTREQQARAYRASGRNNKRVAKHSWHEAGAALDVKLMVNGKEARGDGANAEVELYMNAAGFVRYKYDYGPGKHGHYEIGSERWGRIMRKKRVFTRNSSIKDLAYPRPKKKKRVKKRKKSKKIRKKVTTLKHSRWNL